MSREGNPNAEGEARLEGDLGLSSERTGPFTGIEGTGSAGSTQGRTDGDSPVIPEDAGTAHEDDAARSADRDGGNEGARPDDVKKHPFDPDRNPGHSHG